MERFTKISDFKNYYGWTETFKTYQTDIWFTTSLSDFDSYGWATHAKNVISVTMTT